MTIKKASISLLSICAALLLGFILGPMLGVFLLGMFTRARGSDRGNMIAITVGLITTIVLGELHVAWNSLRSLCFVEQHPCPEELAAAMEDDRRPSCLFQALPKHGPRRTSRTDRANSDSENRVHLIERQPPP